MSEETFELDRQDVELIQITSRAYKSGDRLFVRSKTNARRFYKIQDGVCSCRGYEFNHTCNHTQHLVKEGYLEIDVTDMSYRHTAGKPMKSRAGELVTGTVHVSEGSTEHEQRLSAQVRRLQAVYRRQGKLVDAQRRLLYAIRIDRSRMIQRMVQGVEIETKALTTTLEALEPGDLVELDIS